MVTPNLAVVSLGTHKQNQPNASHFSTCTKLEYFCTSPRIYGKYNHTYPKTLEEIRKLRSVGPAEKETFCIWPNLKTVDLLGLFYYRFFFPLQDDVLQPMHVLLWQTSLFLLP